MKFAFVEVRDLLAFTDICIEKSLSIDRCIYDADRLSYFLLWN